MENRIADQIRFYRKQKGLTQEQLAEAMGVSVAAVSKWEQGQSLPEIPMLMELAAAYDASPSHSAENVRFYEGMETVGIYSDFSHSAVDAAFHAFFDDGGTSEHESFWESVT